MSEQIREQARQIVSELLAQAKLRAGDIFVVGLTDKGRVGVGFSADFTILSPDLKLIATIVGGKVVYRA